VSPDCAELDAHAIRRKPPIWEIACGSSWTANRKTDLPDPLERIDRNSYIVYGLHLVSDSLIPGLTSVEIAPPKTPQIIVRFRADEPTIPLEESGDELLWYTSEIPDEQGNPALRIWKRKANGDFRIHYSHGLEFSVDRDATSVSVHCPDEAAMAEASEFLLGPVLGILLRLRGTTCLHASAVAAGDEAIVFAGAEGAGKSTTAALFVQEGHAALADDIVPLRERGSSFDVIPGYPCLNLWPESCEMLRGTHHRTETRKPAADKQQWALTGEGKGFRGEALPLGAIYLLGERTSGPNALRVEELTAPEALVGLIANTYANKLLEPAMRAREFHLLGRLVNHAPVRRVTPHVDARRLRELHEVILRDIAAARKNAATATALTPIGHKGLASASTLD
jgi:hypothetical protein